MSRGSSGAKKSAGGGLRMKIIVSLGSLLALVTLLAGFCLYTLMSRPLPAAPPSPPPPATAKSAAETDQLAPLLAEAGTIAQQFTQQPSAAAMVKFEEAGKNLQAQALALEKKAREANDPKAIQAAALISEQLAGYRNSFQALAQAMEARGMTENAGLKQKLAEAAQTITLPAASPGNTPDLEEALLKLGRAEQNYFAAPSVENQRLLGQAAADLLKIAGESSLEAANRQALTAQINTYTTALDRYLAVSLATDDPDLAATLSAARIRQEEAMHKAALEMEKLISSTDAAVTDDVIQSLRLAEQEYLSQGSADSAARVNSRLAEYRKALDGATMPPEEKEARQKAAAAYQTAFTALVEQDQKIADHRAATETAFTTLQARVRAISPRAAPAAPPPPQAQASPALLQSLIVIAGGWLAIVLLTLLLGRILTAAVTSPIQRLTDIARRMATQGDYSLAFPAEKNEFGALAGALNVLVRQQTSKVEAGKDSAAKPTEQDDDLARLVRDQADRDRRVAEAVEGLREGLARVRPMVAQLRTESDSLRRSATDLAGFGQAVREGTAGCEQSVAATAETLAAVTRAAAQLTAAINGFTDMAEQTGVMALNAAIKATRAGSQGKEFSEVTEELDHLCKRAAETAREITRLAEGLDSGIATGEKLGQESRQALQDLTATSGAGLQAIEEVDRAAVALQTGVEDAERQLAELGEIFARTDTLVREPAPLNRTIDDTLSPQGATPELAPGAGMFDLPGQA